MPQRTYTSDLQGDVIGGSNAYFIASVIVV